MSVEMHRFPSLCIGFAVSFAVKMYRLTRLLNISWQLGRKKVTARTYEVTVSHEAFLCVLPLSMEGAFSYGRMKREWDRHLCGKNRAMAGEHSSSRERIRFEDDLTLVGQDGEPAYEYLDGRICMRIGGSPDHALIDSNVHGLLRELKRWSSLYCLSFGGVSVTVRAVSGLPRCDREVRSARPGSASSHALSFSRGESPLSNH